MVAVAPDITPSWEDLPLHLIHLPLSFLILLPYPPSSLPATASLMVPNAGRGALAWPVCAGLFIAFWPKSASAVAGQSPTRPPASWRAVSDDGAPVTENVSQVLGCQAVCLSLSFRDGGGRPRFGISRAVGAPVARGPCWVHGDGEGSESRDFPFRSDTECSGVSRAGTWLVLNKLLRNERGEGLRFPGWGGKCTAVSSRASTYDTWEHGWVPGSLSPEFTRYSPTPPRAGVLPLLLQTPHRRDLLLPHLVLEPATLAGPLPPPSRAWNLPCLLFGCLPPWRGTRSSVPAGFVVPRGGKYVFYLVMPNDTRNTRCLICSALSETISGRDTALQEQGAHETLRAAHNSVYWGIEHRSRGREISPSSREDLASC